MTYHATYTARVVYKMNITQPRKNDQKQITFCDCKQGGVDLQSTHCTGPALTIISLYCKCVTTMFTYYYRV